MILPICQFADICLNLISISFIYFNTINSFHFCRFVPTVVTTQKCEPYVRENCSMTMKTVCNEVCKEDCEVKDKKVCMTIPHQECRETTKQICKDIPRSECKKVTILKSHPSNFTQI